MGVYVYALQPPATVRKVMFNGQKIDLGVIQFAYKPGASVELNRRDNHEKVEPLRLAWKRKERPRFVLLGDEQVMSWPRGWVCCTDDDNFGRTVKVVGKLKDGIVHPVEP